ncbi:hypothetical protein FIBSPDRAFT_899309 [Athelia psychrophila]|uniref:Uncharacterized protein n=1 Tax=Athelia psychrophila TaxID=1759441 RepID=A0A165ZVG3_9AGAM|nr:hypothetical protein FIBSPDRAFT_899309 [Fibularhizoctonia sp. CBS 109695]
MTHKVFVLTALEANQYKGMYSDGAIGGLAFIWICLSKAKHAVDTLCIEFNLDTMDRFRNRKCGISPVPGDPFDELPFGSYVWRKDMFSPKQAAIAEAVVECGDVLGGVSHVSIHFGSAAMSPSLSMLFPYFRRHPCTPKAIPAPPKPSPDCRSRRRFQYNNPHFCSMADSMVRAPDQLGLMSDTC